MSTARAERLVNLVLALLSTRQYLSAERIRGIVPGYGDATSDEAYFRMFERDKTELRELGVPLETGRNTVFDGEGYRIARRDYELGEIDLAPDEAAAVGLAARLWDSPELTGQALGALVKLPVPAELRTRTVEPWGVVSWRARWYVVGHDRDRGASRCFRLSRVTGQVHAVGKPGEVRRPEGVNLLKLVSVTGESEPSPVTTALIWAADGRAAGVRRRGKVVGRQEVDGEPGDLIEIGLYFPESAAEWLAAHGPDVLVLEPDVLAKSVQDRLEAVVARQEVAR